MNSWTTSPVRRRLLRSAIFLLLLAAFVLAAVSYEAAAKGTPPAQPRATNGVQIAVAKKICTRFASRSGNDSAPGSLARPFATVQRLVNALRPGQTGCLLSGVFVQDVTVRHGGTDATPIMIRSAPGDTATLQGRLWIAQGADWVTFTYLHLDGLNANFLPSPTIDGNNVTFSYDDVTNDHMGGLHDGDGICFDIGDATGQYGFAHATRIVHDQIHDCGTSDNHNHGIYVAGSFDAVIADNWIYDNADRGVQLYPDAQGTLVENNIIEGNGEGVIVSGDTTQASSNNTVTHNVIIDSRIRHNVEYWWPGPIGTNNIVADNCIYGGHEGNILAPAVGYTITDNLIVQPQFATADPTSPIKPNTACAAFAPK
jgi:parallel beta-helix repeat protein